MTFPRFLFKDRLYLGDVIEKEGDFQIQDFPLPRNHFNWHGIPEKIDFQTYKSFPIPPHPYASPPLLSRFDTPTKEKHARLVEEFLRSGIEKMVLARMATFVFEDFIDPMKVYSHLLTLKGNGTPFGVLLSPHIAFMGCTPEMLFSKEGRVLKTMALAGTRKQEEEHLLLTSTKDMHECTIVKEELYRKLLQISHPFTLTNDLHIRRTHFLSHLYYPFTVELQKEYSQEELLSLLHPTPAIAGRPTQKALELISSMEAFDRGWYCGTFSSLSKSLSETYVCLRSTLIVENKMHIFSGGGIVLESLPENEWQELESKMSLFGAWIR